MQGKKEIGGRRRYFDTNGEESNPRASFLLFLSSYWGSGHRNGTQQQQQRGGGGGYGKREEEKEGRLSASLFLPPQIPPCRFSFPCNIPPPSLPLKKGEEIFKKEKEGKKRKSLKYLLGKLFHALYTVCPFSFPFFSRRILVGKERKKRGKGGK